HAVALCDVSEVALGHIPFERAVRREREGGRTVNGVEVRTQHWDLEDLAVGALDKQAIASLQIVLDLAKGCVFPGGIEDQITLAIFRGEYAVKLWRVVALGDFDRGDHVIAVDRGSIGIDGTAMAVHHYEIAMDSHTGKQRGEDRRLILAIAVAAFQNFACRMR